jgi:hypothetical protein
MDACRLTNATSKGFPTIAPKAPLAVANKTFYSLDISLFWFLK